MSLIENTLLPEQSDPNSNKGIPLALILKYAQKGLTDKEIATQLGCSRANIQKRLAPLRASVSALHEFNKRKLDFVALAQQGAIEEIVRRLHTEGELKKCSTSQLAVVFGVLVDKEQAMKGKGPVGTGNIQVNINFDPGLLPQSDGSKHFDTDNGVLMVDMKQPDDGGNTGGNSEGDK